MTCVCYGNDSYEGCTAPLSIHETVEQAKEWWAVQAALRENGTRPNEGHHEHFAIAEFADAGLIYHYEKPGTRARRGGILVWHITETKETA